MTEVTDLTPVEQELILARRRKRIRDEAYNEGLRDAYNLVSIGPEIGRDETMTKIKSLWRTIEPK